MTPETEARISELRAEVAELRQAAAERNEVSAAPWIDGLAPGDDHYQLKINVTGKSTADNGLADYQRKTWIWRLGFDTSWNEIVERIGPLLLDEGSEREIRDSLVSLGLELSRNQPENWSDRIDMVSKREADESSVNDVIVQLFALDLIARGVKKRTQSNPNRYWVLTDTGRDQVMRLRAPRRPSPAALRARRRKALTKMTVPKLRKLATETHQLDGKGLKQELIDSVLTAEGHGTSTCRATAPISQRGRRSARRRPVLRDAAW